MPMLGDHAKPFLEAIARRNTAEAILERELLENKTGEIETPVNLDLPQLPMIPTDIFPAWIEDMVVAQSEATETPTELGILLVLGVLATACQKKFEISPQDGYREPLNIWVVPAMDSGERKSPVLRGLTGPLHEWQREQLQILAPEIAQKKSERETTLVRIKSLRTKAANASIEDFEDGSREITKLESSLSTIPSAPRLWTQDITPERLGTLLAEQGEKISIISDEGGIFDLMGGRYNNGIPNIDVFLQGYSGSFVCVDRQAKESIHLHSPAVTMCLSPQPQVLRGLTEKPGFRGRGLLGRFLYALPPSKVGFRTGDTQPISTAILTRYTENIKGLLNVEISVDLDGTPSPHLIRFSREASHEWHEFSQRVEVEMREGGRLEHLKDWGGKLPGNTARVAGLLHCAQHVKGNPEHHHIDKNTMGKAIGLSALLIPHALAAFDLMGADPNLEAARKVWTWVQRQREKTFTARNCFQALKTPYPKMAMLTPAFEVLMERYYIYKNNSLAKPGRPSTTFAVNPVLTEGWND